MFVKRGRRRRRTLSVATLTCRVRRTGREPTAVFSLQTSRVRSGEPALGRGHSRRPGQRGPSPTPQDRGTRRGDAARRSWPRAATSVRSGRCECADVCVSSRSAHGPRRRANVVGSEVMGIRATRPVRYARRDALGVLVAIDRRRPRRHPSEAEPPPAASGQCETARIGRSVRSRSRR